MAEPQRWHFSVERLRPDHAPQWRRLFRLYADFYSAPVTDAVLDRTWALLQHHGHRLQGLAALDASGTLVGIAHVQHAFESLDCADAGVLDDLYVDAPWRGRGVGRALIAAVMGLARQRGWSHVRWITMRTNTQAQHVYDALASRTPWVVYEART